MAKVAHTCTKHFFFSLPWCPPFFLLSQDGRTPLDLAKKEKNREVTALLEVHPSV